MGSMRDAVQGRDTSVRGIIFKGRFVQGAQHPRTFGRGHIGRGHINPASNARPSSFIISTITYNVVVILQLRRQIHSHYFSSTPICTLWTGLLAGGGGRRVARVGKVNWGGGGYG